MAMWVMAVVGAAPCQCFSPGANHDDVAGPDFLDRAALALRRAAAGGDDQRLPQRMGVPGGARAGLEGDAAPRPAPDRGPEQRVDADRAGEPVRRPLADGCEPLRLMSIVFVHSSATSTARGNLALERAQRLDGNSCAMSYKQAYECLDAT